MTSLRGPAARRRLVTEAAIIATCVQLGLRFVGYSSLERRLARWAHGHRAQDTGTDNIDSVVRAVHGVSRRLSRMTCLVQALTTHAMLSRRGVRTFVRLGVRSNAAPTLVVDAHAWVETLDGRVVIGDVPGLADYQTLESTTSRLMRHLAALLRGDRVAWATLGTDADSVFAYCDDGDLVGLVHQAIVSGLASDWPAVLVGRLADRARLDAAIELIRGQEIRRVLATLAGAGIPAVLLKGTALAYSRYAQPALRPRADTDLLIPRADRETARAALVDLGYMVSDSHEGDVLFRQVELQRCDQHGVVHAFDIHWQISNQERFARMFGDDELWQRSEPLGTLGPPARAVGAVDALLISCMHPVMHHRADARLIWMYDTHVIASTMTTGQWNTFVELARTKALAAVCRHGLELASAQFHTVIPDVVIRDLAAGARTHEPSADYLVPGRTWRDELASNFKALPGWRARAKLLREMALPAPAHLRRAYGLEQSTLGWLLLPALYAYRGLKAVYKK